jgi:ubiquinone/menaquinone biosynthesis C-methylase UbiE
MTVFNSLYASAYDTLYTDKNYAQECDLIAASCAKFDSAPASILDIGCGTGSHVMEWSRRGLDCVGVDLSSDMLSIAQSKSDAEGTPHKPKWIQGDARNFDAGGQYDLATMMFAVVSYLTTNEDVLACLSNIRKHLKPGALFMCDFWYGPAVLSVRPNERVRVIEVPQGRTIRAAATTVDSFAQTADVDFRLWTIEGERYLGETRETHRMRYFFPQEFNLLLSMCGFESLSLSQFPSLDLKLTDESWNAFCVAVAR